MPEACEILSERRGLLVPVGFVLAAQALFGLLTRIPGLHELLTDGANFNLLGISVALSLATVYSIVIWTAFASWQTDLLWRAVHGEDQPSLAPGPPIRQHFFRVQAALAVGVVVMLVALIPALALSALVMILGLLVMGALGVIWNLLTVVLLPVTMYTDAVGRVDSRGDRYQLGTAWALDDARADSHRGARRLCLHARNTA